MNPANDQPNAGNATGGTGSEVPPKPTAADEFSEQVLSFIEQIRPLVTSFFQAGMAKGALLIFLAREETRLYFGRAFAWLCALGAFIAAWIFFCSFLWHGAVALTGQIWAGPLALMVIHLIVGSLILRWRNSLRITPSDD